MTGPIEAAQALDIDVQELARPVAFVADGWRRSIELLQPIQPGSAAHACSSRRTHSHNIGDLPNGEPLPTWRDDARSCRLWCRTYRVRPRTAVRQRFAHFSATQP